MNALLLAAVIGGGALGATARFGLTKLTLRWRGRFPYGILLANMLGSLLAGLLLGLQFFGSIEEWWVTGLLFGFCGGLTTLSSWAVDSVLMAGRRDFVRFALNTLGTVLVVIASAGLGFFLSLFVL